jgi:predicted metal-dependent hydrolase
MRSTHRTRTGTLDHILLGDKEVEFRLISSSSATKLRIRVGIAGIEVIQPEGRDDADVSNFLQANSAWIVDQLDRVERFHNIRRPKQRVTGRMLFRGELLALQIEEDPNAAGANRVIHHSDRISVRRSPSSDTPTTRTLENWLRKQARINIAAQLEIVVAKLRRQPGKVLIMNQRTKWGNCSSMQNLSFNWRLIMAPDFVLRYIVTHEAVHLAIPDHSQKFWLTVRSLCPESERAKQWLSANGHRLLIDLSEITAELRDGTTSSSSH